MMKAQIVRAPYQMEYTEVPVPEINDDEVLIKVKVCGICGSDTSIYTGKYAKDKLPMITGHEFWGVVEKVGKNAQGVNVGDRVAAVSYTHLFRVFDGAKEIVVDGAGFFFRSQIFGEIGDGIPFGLKFNGRERKTGSSLRPQGGSVIDVISIETTFLDLLHRQILGELIDHGAYDLHVSQLFCTNVCQESAYRFYRHGVALRQITHRSAEFSVGTAILTDDQFCCFRTCFGDFYWKL